MSTLLLSNNFMLFAAFQLLIVEQIAPAELNTLCSKVTYLYISL